MQCGDFCEAKSSVGYEIIFPKNQPKDYCVRNIIPCSSLTNMSENEIYTCDNNLKCPEDNKKLNTRFILEKLRAELLSLKSSEEIGCIFENKNEKESIVNIYENKNLCFDSNHILCDRKITCKCIQTDVISSKQSQSKDTLIQFYIDENKKLRKELNKDKTCIKCQDINNNLQHCINENLTLKHELEKIRTRILRLKNIVKDNSEEIEKNNFKVTYLDEIDIRDIEKISVTSNSLKNLDSYDSLLNDNIFDHTNIEFTPTSLNWSNNLSDISSYFSTATIKKNSQQESSTESIIKIASSQNDSQFSKINPSENDNKVNDIENVDSVILSENETVSSNAGSKFHLYDEIMMTSSQSYEIVSSVKKKGQGHISFPKTDFNIYIYEDDNNT